MIHVKRIDAFMLACMRDSAKSKYCGKTWRVQIGIPFLFCWSFGL